MLQQFGYYAKFHSDIIGSNEFDKNIFIHD